VFGVILVGAFVGWVIKERVPKHHLSDETKSTMTVSMAVIATPVWLGAHCEGGIAMSLICTKRHFAVGSQWLLSG
jgi:hypothetical protein